MRYENQISSIQRSYLQNEASKLLSNQYSGTLVLDCFKTCRIWYSAPFDVKYFPSTCSFGFWRTAIGRGGTATENKQEVSHVEKITAKRNGGQLQRANRKSAMLARSLIQKEGDRQKVLPNQNKGSRSKSRGLFGTRFQYSSRLPETINEYRGTTIERKQLFPSFPQLWPCFSKHSQISNLSSSFKTHKMTTVFDRYRNQVGIHR